MTLVDTSVWVDFIRATGSRADRALAELDAERPEEIATTEPIAMELLVGPTDEFTARRVEQLVDGAISLDVVPHFDFREAAGIHRSVRRSGRTPRSVVDCLIAAIALRHDVELLHKDADFEVIAEVTGLKHRSLRDPE